MKKLLGFATVLLLVLGFSGCEKKSEMEKAQDSISKAYEDTKNAVKKAAE